MAELGFTHPQTKLILIIDDDDNVRSFLETFISNEGFQVAVAKNGEEGLVKVGQLRPHLVITDLRMPGEGGYEIVRKLQGEGTEKIPVIVITATKLDDSTVGMIRQEANVVDFHAKPIEIPVLLNTIHSALKTVRPEQKTSPREERDF